MTLERECRMTIHVVTGSGRVSNDHAHTCSTPSLRQVLYCVSRKKNLENTQTSLLAIRFRGSVRTTPSGFTACTYHHRNFSKYVLLWCSPHVSQARHLDCDLKILALRSHEAQRAAQQHVRPRWRLATSPKPRTPRRGHHLQLTSDAPCPNNPPTLLAPCHNTGTVPLTLPRRKRGPGS